MRKFLLSSAIVLATGFSGAVLADHHGKAGDRHAKHMEYIAEKLELSADQQTQLKSLHEQHGEKHREVRKEHQAEVNAILTEEQQAKMAEMREKKHEKMKAKYAEKGENKYVEKSKKKHVHEEKGSE